MIPNTHKDYYGDETRWFVGSVKSLHGIIMGLENRIQTMNNDMIKLDILVSHALNVKPDEERIARADGKDDARKD